MIIKVILNSKINYQRPNGTSLNPEQVTELLRMCLTTTYFKFDGKFYAQIEGAAMGSPVSPIVANLFMEQYERKALATYSDPPKYWGRYVDDAFSIVKTSKIEEFSQHLNSRHASIQWTSELEENKSLPMLDTPQKRLNVAERSGKVVKRFVT